MAVGEAEGVAGVEVGGVGPAVAGDVPVRVVLGRGEGVGAVLSGHRDVGEILVAEGLDDRLDLFGPSLPREEIVEHTYYQFNVGNLNSLSDKIGAATLKVTQTYSADWSCTNTYGVHAVYSNTAIGHSTEWGNQPNGTSFGDTANVGGTGSSGCTGDVDFSFNALTPVKNTLQLETSTLTFGLTGDESNANGFKRLSNKALLSVTYDSANLPTGQTSSPTPQVASAGTTNRATRQPIPPPPPSSATPAPRD